MVLVRKCTVGISRNPPCQILRPVLCFPQEYKDSVFPPDVTARVSIEAGSTFGWLKYVGAGGKSIGVDTFGASAPGPALYELFGITVKAVVDAANSL